MQPLAGKLVVDLTRYLPGPVATRELVRLGARVVRVVRPQEGDYPMLPAGWDAALTAGKEALVCDLKADPAPVQALIGQADVVVETFRPGVASRLGVGPERAGERTVYCSISGFGPDGPHAHRAGHDLNYLGWAGALAETAPAMPPLPFADLAGALHAVGSILAALLERERTGRGARLAISLTHSVHDLAEAQPLPGVLTGALACYRVYETADGRHLTVGALEQSFFRRLCELVGRPEIAARQFDAEAQTEIGADLAAVFRERPLAEWLRVFDGEDVAVGPVASRDEARRELGA